MSSKSSIRIPIEWSNVNVFTFGKSSLYGYDGLNHCLVIHSPVQLNETNEISNDRFHFSSLPTWPIERLILNDDETILALLAENIAYLVYLPQSKNSPSKGSRLCPIIRIPPSALPSAPINCSLIDFVWLTSKHFAIVYSIPSSSECHLYALRPSKQDGIERIRTLTVGSIPENKFGTPGKKISLHQPSDIIKLDVTKRKSGDIDLILLFAMKNDGDMFVLEILSNELLSENEICGEFHGPIRILPSTFDNYGADHGQSTFLCLSSSTSPLLVFTRDKYQLNECIILSPSVDEYYLYTIDLISLPKDVNGQMLTSIIADPFSANRYFLSDSLGNVYSIEISWIEQIKQGSKQLQSTHLQHLINGTNTNTKLFNQILAMSVIRTNNDQEYLSVIVKKQTNEQKELILIRLKSSKCQEDSSSEFISRIRSLLIRDQSIPHLTLSTSTKNLSQSDLEKNLSRVLQIFSNEYLRKQEKVQREIENKQRYLVDFEQTQMNEKKQLTEKFTQIEQQFQNVREQYKHECNRRQRLSTHCNDLLSVIEQRTPVLSDTEIRMQQQLETYQTQIAFLKEKIEQLEEFISFNQTEGYSNIFSLVNIHDYVLNHRSQIEHMKERLQSIQNNK